MGVGHDARRRLAPALLAGRRCTRASGRCCRRCSLGGVGMAMTMSPMTVGRDGRRPGRQGRRRLGRAQQLPPGRRLARDRARSARSSPPTCITRPARRAGAQDYVNGLHAALARQRGDRLRGGGRRGRDRCGRAPRSSGSTSPRWPRDDGDAPARGRAPAGDRRDRDPRSSRRAATAARRRRRSRAPPASPSRSSTGTSTRSAISTSLRSTTCGSRRAAAWERTLAATPDACAAVEAIGREHVSVRVVASSSWPSSGCRRSAEAAEDPELREPPAPAHARGARLHR